MCGRFTLAAELETFAEDLAGLTVEFNPGPRYNIAPTQAVATILNDGRQAVVSSRWGLVPSWAKDLTIGARMINARAETLSEKPSFRTLLEQRRCLVLADGFYEWLRKPGQPAKAPHYFRLSSRGVFAFAGLWDEWQPPVGDPVRTCTIITTTPNECVAPVHDRMPVILTRDHYALWLSREGPEPEALRACLQPYPADKMESLAISKHVNRVGHDDARCIEPAANDDRLAQDGS